MINDRARKVMIGFLNLSPEAKIEFLRELESVKRDGEYWQDVKKKNLMSEERSSLGPKNSICDCCGR